MRERISVIHDGIDTNTLVPNPDIQAKLNKSLALTKRDEVITFVNRNLEPYRGYHIFMRSLPELLKRRPKVHVMIVGGDGVSYGRAPDPKRGSSWKEIFLREVLPQIPKNDLARIHFLGRIPYQAFVSLLQLSTVHVYLTYPFVLSWSLLEAMSCGCAIVASNTQPVQEVIEDNQTGRLVDFFDIKGLTDQICTLLDSPKERKRLGANARQFVREHYDLKTICLPKQIQWVESLL